MTLLFALLVVIGFAGIVGWTHLPAHAGEVACRARGSYAVVSDRSLSDDQKERRLRDEAPRLFTLLGRILVGGTLALGLPFGALWALDRMGLVSMSDVLAMLIRADFIVGVSVAGVVAGWWMGRRAR